MRYKPIVVSSAIVFLAMALLLNSTSILLAIGDFLVVGDALQPANLIHLLGGGEPGRFDYAIDLYQQGYGQRIFATGDRSNPAWVKTNSDCPFEEYLICKGVRPEDLLPDQSGAISTYDEAVELKQFLASDQGMSVRSVIIVSDPYHMRRVSWTFRRVLGNRVKLQFAPVPFERSRFNRRWWVDAVIRQTVKDEYIKLLFYCVRYQRET